MAQFNADIQLKVLVDGLNQAVNKVNNAVEKIEKKGLKLNAQLTKGFAKQIDQAAASVKRLASLLKGVGAGGGAAGLVSLVNAFGQLRGINLGPLEQVAGALAKITDPLLQAVAQFPGLTAAIIGTSAAAAAFSPQIGEIIKQLEKVAPVAGRVREGITSMLQSTVLMAFGSQLKDQINDWSGYSKAVQVATDKISQLRKAQDALQKSLNTKATSDKTALNTAAKLAEVQERLTNAYRDQRDLIRQAKGVNVEELEASKGRNSIKTRQKQQELSARQAQEYDAVQKSLLKLAQTQAEVDNARLNARAEQEQIRQEQMVQAANNETIKSLERRLAIEEKIANVRSSRAARTASAGAQRQEQLSSYRGDLRAEGAGRASAFAKLQQVENKAKLEASRLTQQLAGEQAAHNRVIAESTARFEATIAANKRASKAEKERQAAVKNTTAVMSKGNKRIESLALGVGFPLLFGGGAGSILGSAAGSFVGDQGFGGQIFGGAIGQILDDFIASAGDLGSALNPATADTEKLIEALGATDTPFEDLIDKLEKSGREATALALATQRMVDLVGKDGVDALKEFGADSTRLGNEFAKAMSFMKAGVAELINSAGIFKAIADQIGRANLINQARNSGNADQAARFQEFERAGVGFGNPTEKAAERARIMQEIIDAQIQLNAEADREAQIRARLAEFDAAKVREIRATVAEKQIELEIEQLNAAANDQTRIALEQKLAFQQLMTEQQKLYNQFATDQITIDVLRLKLAGARLDYEKQIASIKNAADAATARAAKAGRSGGGGGVDKEAQTQKAIAAQLTKQFELETKLATIGVTKLDKINTELERLDQRKALKVAELELSKEDERIKAIKLENLNKETEILRQQLELQRERAQIEQQMTALKGEQQIAGLQRGLDQELAGLTLPSGSSFQDERDQLAFKQQNRYANAITEVNDLIAQQELLATSSDAAIADAATKKLELLERQKGVYETMLPAIAQAEQQQLKFNQTLSLVEGPVNAFVSGLTSGLQGIIDGTMTAEEAFANMLKGMADALIQTATQMIAQYIAIGIARAFAGMGTSSTPTAPAAPNGTQVYGGQLINTGISAAADGGPAFTNRPMLVGERGPELFVPRANGRVVNNADSRAALDRYTPNSSYNYSPNLSITTGPVMQMNNEDYIRREDFERGLRQASDDGAKRGEAMTLRRLKNSRSTRSTLGM